MQIVPSSNSAFLSFGANAPLANEIFKNSTFTAPETGNRATGWEATAGNPLSNISNGGLNVNGNTDTVQTVAMIVGNRYTLTATLRSCTVGTVQILTNSGGNGQIPSGLGPNMLTSSITFTAVSSGELYYIRGTGGTDAIMSTVSLTPA